MSLPSRARFSFVTILFSVLAVLSAPGAHADDSIVQTLINGRTYSCTPTDGGGGLFPPGCWSTCGDPARGNSTSDCKNICGN